MAVVVLWQAMLFENVALLEEIKSFLHWRWTPRRCFKCAYEELTTWPDVCRLLRTCRWLAACNINEEDVALHDGRPCVFDRSCSFIAVSQTRFLRHAAHHNIQQMRERTQERVERLWNAWHDQHYWVPGGRMPSGEEGKVAMANFMQQEIPRCAFHADSILQIELGTRGLHFPPDRQSVMIQDRTMQALVINSSRRRCRSFMAGPTPSR